MLASLDINLANNYVLSFAPANWFALSTGFCEFYFWFFWFVKLGVGISAVFD